MFKPAILGNPKRRLKSDVSVYNDKYNEPTAFASLELITHNES